ncbi:PadR family transcriptional regulator [uncultured Pseudacidovorax sp.]|uniref:PadR family transcriptional regulator n=1 Tax=uncultured Pseudacidovorax sp. TaxID=679313 RepID=UPI0025EB8DF8|nr:PadR family transcriptional regulator [uncultured Pseudacidovorax sp.]
MTEEWMHPGRGGGRGHGHRRSGADTLAEGAMEGRGGGRRPRQLEPGDLRLLMLHALAAQPSHGYELIKAIGECVGGDYTPSPGTVYPTLALLEDLGLARSEASDGGRKRFHLTPQGEAERAAQASAIEAVLERLAQARARAHARRLPEIRRAMENLKMALRLRLEGEMESTELVRRLAEIIDRAAVEVERA